ncbi:Ig-like domain-containing protein [Streptomyces decoyicus]|uniref:Ig-like domain-containing protein n=1 Tax=Streptomyces decoyicus TaxID=249567 RepID=UPI0033B9B971
MSPTGWHPSPTPTRAPPAARTRSPPPTATLSGGTATTTHVFSGTSGSPYTLTAAHNGDASFTASSGTDTQTVNQSTTTTTLTSTPDPSVVGQTVTVKATVASGSGAPSGTVSFVFGDGTSPATAALSGGTASVTHPYTTTTGSPFTLTAAYSGDTSFTASTGTDTQTVNRAATTSAVISTPNPSSTGERVTVTATVAPVAPGAGTPTGTVTLAVTGRTPQTVALTNGTATATFSPLPKGTHSVTANYNGDVGFTSSTGTAVHTVA